MSLLRRARSLGIEPNTIMYNTAISALGKASQWEAAEKLFNQMPTPDTISFETMIAAYGLAGQIGRAETFFNAMLEAGHVPRDYAFCGLIAAYRYLFALISTIEMHSTIIWGGAMCSLTLAAPCAFEGSQTHSCCARPWNAIPEHHSNCCAVVV